MVGKGLDELEIFWFEEPVAPENYNRYRELKTKNLLLVLQEGEG
jgi:L-alanine-DL-glutamate epimerase and related enzymes of enolase superfamily